MLRDRIVCGINKPWIQRRLLAKCELTYQSAFELAQSMELLTRTLMICKLHLEVSHKADKMIFITYHERGIKYHVTFVIVVEVIIKLQIASTRMLYARTAQKRVTWQKCVAVHQLGLKFRGTRSSDCS